MKIALFGGSFNPPHVGHQMATLYVRATRPVDEVWLAPTFHHPFGKDLALFEHRVAMCEAMARDLGPWLKVSRIEQEVGGEGRTVDTLVALRGAHPEHQWVLVIGSDILKDLPSWKDFPRLRTLAEVLVLNRAGHPAAEAVGPPLAEVSSTLIRERLESRVRPDGLVPRAVLDYVERHGLYGFR